MNRSLSFYFVFFPRFLLALLPPSVHVVFTIPPLLFYIVFSFGYPVFLFFFLLFFIPVSPHRLVILHSPNLLLVLLPSSPSPLVSLLPITSYSSYFLLRSLLFLLPSPLPIVVLMYYFPFILFFVLFYFFY